MITTWQKHHTAPYVDIARKTVSNPHPSADWARVGKSTIFDLALNANTVTFDFIENESPSEFLKNYKPTLAQELRTVRGDKAFDAIFEIMYNLPTSDEAVHDFLLVFPAIKTMTGGNPSMFAWLAPASLIVKNFNTVDEKILFDVNFAGDIIRGTVTTGIGGMPEFEAFPNQREWIVTTDALPEG